MLSEISKPRKTNRYHVLALCVTVWDGRSPRYVCWKLGHHNGGGGPLRVGGDYTMGGETLGRDCYSCGAVLSSLGVGCYKKGLRLSRHLSCHAMPSSQSESPWCHSSRGPQQRLNS
jgi:hypothetical protein